MRGDARLRPRLTEPSPDTAGTELELLGGDLMGWSCDPADRCRSAEEGDVDTRHLVVAELEIANPAAVVLRRSSAGPQASGDGEASAEGPTEGSPLLSTGAREAGLESVGPVEPVGPVGTAGEQAANTITRTATARARTTGERTAES